MGCEKTISGCWGFVMELTDISDLNHPHGDISTGGNVGYSPTAGIPPKSVGISLNILF
jgi:hypothetical protein